MRSLRVLAGLAVIAVLSAACSSTPSSPTGGGGGVSSQLAASCAPLASTPSGATLVEYGGPAKDGAYVYSGQPHTTHYEPYTLLASHVAYRTLIRFQTTVPAGAHIVSASLSFTPAIAAPGSIQVHPESPFNPEKVTWSNQPKWNTKVIGISAPLNAMSQTTVPLKGLTGSGMMYVGLDYNTPGFIARIMGYNSELFFPILDVTYEGTPPPTTTTTHPVGTTTTSVPPTTTSTSVPPTTTTSTVPPTTTTSTVPATTTTGVPPTTTTTSVPPSTTTTTIICPPPTTTTTGPVPTTTTTTQPSGGTFKVDGISDGGPSSGNWTSGLAKGLIADKPQAVLWAGDVRDSGTAGEWNIMKANYAAVVPIMAATPGNHDNGNRAAAGGFDSVFAASPLTDAASPWCKGGLLGNGWTVFTISTYNEGTCLPMLKTWLAAHPGTKNIVVAHEPRYSGGSGHGSSSAQQGIWAAMFPGHAFMLFSGHDHDAQVIETAGGIQVVNGCAGAAYYSVSPLSGTDYYSTSSGACTYSRFLLGTSTATIQQVTASGSVAFTKTFQTP